MLETRRMIDGKVMVLITVGSEKEKLLRKKSRQVELYREVELSILQVLIDSLSRILNEKQAQGIAAPQIGEPICLFIMKYKGTELVVVNPILKHKKGAQNVIERCLSIPDKWFQVRRPISMTLFGMNMKGEEIKIKCDEYLSSVVEHEVDHLDGILIDKKGREVGVNKDTELAYPKLAYA